LDAPRTDTAVKFLVGDVAVPSAFTHADTAKLRMVLTLGRSVPA
jgi:hypothetical protein